MITLAWVALGYMGVVFWAALSPWLLPWHLVPDAALVTVVFLAPKREMLPTLVISFFLAYLVGRLALAPFGLYETALALTALVVYRMAGHLVGAGAAFFGLLVGSATLGYHLLLMVLCYLGEEGMISSTRTLSAVVPAMIVNAVLAMLMFYPMMKLEQNLTPKNTNDEGLAWH
ncbi:hypothetical protein KAI87_02460 [Myxococcota bacterium]|nr:hypothetical protein [Myxococcota bacterium]